MLIRVKLAPLVLALAGLVVVPGFAFGKEAALRAAQQRRALLKTLPQGKPFGSGGQQYRFVGGVRAVLRGAEETANRALARAGAAPTDLVEAKGHHLLFRQASKVGPVPAQVSVNDTATLPVVVNARTGTFGIVLGIIVVRLRETSDAGAVGAAHGLDLVSSAAHLSTAFYQV